MAVTRRQLFATVIAALTAPFLPAARLRGAVIAQRKIMSQVFISAEALQTLGRRNGKTAAFADLWKSEVDELISDVEVR